MAFCIEEEKQNPASFSHLRFSSDGQHILAVIESRVYILDAFKGGVKAVVRTSTDGEQESGLAYEASFSPNGQYFSAGCDDQTVKTWRVDSGELVGQMCTHAGRRHVVVLMV